MLKNKNRVIYLASVSISSKYESNQVEWTIKFEY